MSSDNVLSKEKYIEEGDALSPLKKTHTTPTPTSKHRTPSKKTRTPTSKHRTPSKKTRTPTSKHRTPSKKTRRPTRTNVEKDYYNRNIRSARANNVAEFVEFFKENFGEESFTRFIWLLSTPVASTRGYNFSDSPSFLIDITKEFFDLLKNMPDLPRIVVPLREIIEKYGPKTLYGPPLSPDKYMKECDEIVDKFISDNKLDANSELATSIKLFFTRVVSILLDFIDKNSLKNTPEARIAVQQIMKGIFSVFEKLIRLLNENKKYYKMIQGFTVEDLIKYGKAERESDIKKLKEEDAAYYRGEYQISQGLFELAEKRQEERDDRRQQRVHAGLEGGRRKKMHSRNYYKKRTHKIRAYKKK
jgi:hypothetical protein